MNNFDNWPPFQDFSFQEFSFPVDKYVVWQDGQIIDSGDVNFRVYFKYSGGNFFSRKVSIDVSIANNPISQTLLSRFTFDRATTSGDRILFYIAAESSNVQNPSVNMLASLLGYTRSRKDYARNEPVVASVYTINQNVAKVSFSLGNPDRLIELL